MKIKDIGWVWEGQAFDPGVYPSIFGVGEGAEYFGLKRACYLYHPNNELAMKKMSYLEEIVCDISKWKCRDIFDGNTLGPYGVANWVDNSQASVCAEAENVSILSKKFPNITGAIHDDMKILTKREGYTPEAYEPIYTALHSKNPKLKLWSVVYTHELSLEEWSGYTSYMDVINLWVWNANDLLNLDEYVKRCKEIFPDKPIIMGCYLRDYPSSLPVPMELLKFQFERILHYINDKLIDGYSILGTVLIDGHQEQANWIRDFIAAN